MATNDTLDRHQLLQLLHADIQPLIGPAVHLILAEFKKTGWVTRKKGPAQLPFPDSYYYGVHYHVANLVSAVDRLEQVSVFLRSFPNRRTYEKHNVTRDIWIRYHYAHFLITVVSLYDIALILTNFVFQLGIPEAKCKHDVVTENAWVKSTKVKEALTALDKAVKPYREARHLHVHRGQLPNLDQLEMLDFFSSPELYEPSASIRRDVNRVYSLATRDIVENLGPTIELLTTKVLHLFDALLPVYQRHHTQ